MAIPPQRVCTHLQIHKIVLGEVFKLMEEEGETTETPPTTPELKCWIVSLEKSSESTKKEQLSNSQNGKQD